MNVKMIGITLGLAASILVANCGEDVVNLKGMKQETL